ncbi:nucleoside-triphosphatase [Thermovenabulum sp.]|uniref:nucleoside-triphosphatase n=1 Tax=Thermovenabulum sp. TaxID=3100335 RepID=UPI003C7DFE70
MNRKKNIFITGKRRVGKSTIIDKVINKIELEISGFKTKPFFNSLGEVVAFTINSASNADCKEEPQFIAKKIDKRKWMAQLQTFETYGVELLRKSLYDESKVIVMDEIGFFEASACNFQKMINECLSSEKVVFGVIKPIPLPFIKKIKNREDVVIYEITKDNREEEFEKILKDLREVLTSV